MVSRFVLADNDVIKELKTSGENVNTRSVLLGVFYTVGVV